jgi:membrane protein insertase Oxa1/YidC/SpoIIIJ
VAVHLVSAAPVRTVEALMYALHDAAALPWWATIVAVTLCLRVLLVPLNVALLKNSLRMKLVARRVGDGGRCESDQTAAG